MAWGFHSASALGLERGLLSVEPVWTHPEGASGPTCSSGTGLFSSACFTPVHRLSSPG